MKKERDYIQDIADIRSMMERSSKFLSLSGWAGIMAGMYALVGAYIAYKVFHFNPDQIFENTSISAGSSTGLGMVIILALIILALAIGTAIVLSSKKAQKRNEKVWSATSKRLLTSMAVPLVAGGVLILILLSKGLIGLVAPLTLLFYGLALYNASKFTYDEVRSLGMIQIGLGLIGSHFTSYGLFLWAVGFGLVHIAYGIYMHINYER
ncbi:hypothetical protein WJR50_20030 [Catalinimonas sp. 4WD22]|uniref:hypothetical protein n=1 Tax=Catalinimonas locisalis TaxID=3133978 RepID=UPI003100FE0C